MSPVYADHPFPLVSTPKLQDGKEHDMFEEVASHMALVHNMIIRGLNSIYLQAPHITGKDEKGFCQYTLFWYQLLHMHHSGEERDLFPLIEKMTGEEGVMATNIEQHQAFHDGLETFIAYVRDCLAGKQKYGGSKMVTLIDSFGTTLAGHLADEISSLLDLRRFGTEKMKTLPARFDEEGQKAMKEAGLVAGLPYAFVNIDRQFEDGRWKEWPPAPGFILFIVKYITYWIHSDWWKFGSCDRNFQLKPLYAVPEEKKD